MIACGLKNLTIACLSIFALPVFAQWSGDTYYYDGANQDPNRGKFFYVTASSLNVRSATGGTVVTKISQSTRVKVIASEGNWLEVQAVDATGKTVTGYVYRNYLSRRQPAAQPVPPTQAPPPKTATAQAPPATATPAPTTSAPPSDKPVSKTLECVGNINDKNLAKPEFNDLQPFITLLKNAPKAGMAFESRQQTAFQITGSPQIVVTILALSPKLTAAVAKLKSVSEAQVTGALADTTYNPPFNAGLCTKDGKFYLAPLLGGGLIRVVPSNKGQDYRLSGPLAGVKVDETFSNTAQ